MGPRPGRARRGGRPAKLLACLLTVGSLLAVAGAQAYLTQGQVRLTRLQQGLQAQLAQERQLEIQVAELQNPTHIISQAQSHGMVAPQQVGDLAQVPTSGPSTTVVGTSPTTTSVVSPAPASPTVPTTPASSTPASSTSAPSR